MNAPDASGTESLVRELLVEVLDFSFCQFGERCAFEVRYDVIEDQIPIAVLCVVCQLSLDMAVEPVFRVVADGDAGFFHRHFLLSQHNTYHRKEIISRRVLIEIRKELFALKTKSSFVELRGNA